MTPHSWKKTPPDNHFNLLIKYECERCHTSITCTDAETPDVRIKYLAGKQHLNMFVDCEKQLAWIVHTV